MRELEQAFLELRQCYAEDRPLYALSVYEAEYGLEGHLVLWNLPPQPDPHLGAIAKGGTRVSSGVSLGEVELLAKTMALKNATANLPLGGAKSGLAVDPDSAGAEIAYRAFVRRLSPLLSERGGPFGGFGFDVGARPEMVRWVCDELNSTRSFTGKPKDLGGTDYDIEGIAGLGVAVAAHVALKAAHSELSKIRYAVQGAGAMGAGVIRYFSQFGAQLHFISDPRLGGCFELLQPVSNELLSALAEMRFPDAMLLLEREAGAPQDLDEVIAADVDVFFPCATQDVLNQHNIERVQARYIVEGANNPSSAEARRLFAAKGGTLVPDVLANPGGIIAAYVELCAAAGQRPPTHTSLVQHAKNVVRERIERNVSLVLQSAEAFTMPVAQAAELLALSRLYPQAEAARFVHTHVLALGAPTKG